MAGPRPGGFGHPKGCHRLFPISTPFDHTSAPAEEWLEQLPLASQQKFAALFVRMGDTGKIWNERKFKHLTGTDKIFEFKVEADRVLCFFFVGKRLILTHGFRKPGDKTPRGEIERAEACKREFEQGGRT